MESFNDEWVYLSDNNKKKKDQFFIAQLTRTTIRKGLRQYKGKFLKQFMIVSGFCYNGKFKIKKFQEKPKLISQSNILEPIFEEEILAFHGEDMIKLSFIW